jgi:hypothetical protein
MKLSEELHIVLGAVPGQLVREALSEDGIFEQGPEGPGEEWPEKHYGICPMVKVAYWRDIAETGRNRGPGKIWTE